jgi:hypothetical protein
MLTKLKYTGVCAEDLLAIYRLFIRSRAEYMSVLWHTELTSVDEQKIENIQKSSLKIILQEMYIDYESSLEICGLKKLSDRRKLRCVSFAKICLKNKETSKMFPINPEYSHDLRNTEKYHIHFAHRENYKNSSVPYCQKLLNQDHKEQEERKRAKGKEQEAKTREQEARKREQEARTGQQEEVRTRKQEGPLPGGRRGPGRRRRED